MKRLFDILASFFGLLVLLPILLPIMLLVFLQDYHSPFYIAPRVGKRERLFRMVKLRSMVMNADKKGVDSTSANDSRITPIGAFIRKFKLDELMQLWNVLKGDMSMVGPRPNVKRETDLYTPIEKAILNAKPGITDFASIVFSDEGDILKDKDDPDLAYNQLIRPWKSRLALLYIEKQNFFLDLKIVFYTLVAVVSRQHALEKVVKQLKLLNAPVDVTAVAGRIAALEPCAPPGATDIVRHR